MSYECKHAYSRDDVPYILCDREKAPAKGNQKDISHACCPFQRFCGTRNCKVLTAQWTGCLKNKHDGDTQKVMEAKASAAEAKPKSASKKKSTKKA